MLGHMVYHTLSHVKNFDIFDLSGRRKLNKNTVLCDIENLNELKSIIQNIRPDFIINCIGLLIKGSSENKEKAIFINAYLPNFLQSTSEEFKFKLVHISTDCVFSGKVGKYSERSIPDSNELYGKTKSLGEFNDNKNLCIRTSIIGLEIKSKGEGLMHWLFSQSGKIYGFKNVFWSGVTTLELSKSILFALNNNITGLWNLTNGIEINKFDLIKLLKDEFLLNSIYIIEKTDIVSNKSLVSIRNINYKVPSYSQMIKELKEYYVLNKSLYKYNIG